MHVRYWSAHSGARPWLTERNWDALWAAGWDVLWRSAEPDALLVEADLSY
jgi:hypothetical protein